MRQLLLLFAITVFFTACKEEKPPKTLEAAFLLSLEKNDFNVLKSFLPDKEFYISQISRGNETPEQVDAIVAKKIEDLTVAWQNAIYNVAAKKIDLSKVMVKEVIFHDPFPGDTVSEAMTVDYEYKGSTWDDIQFVVSRKTEKTILLNIPNPARAFSMFDRELRATNEARAWIEIGKPEFKKTVEELSNKIIAAARANNINEFGQYLLNRGDNELKRWRIPLNMNDSLERKQAQEIMQRLNRNMEHCDTFQTGNIVTNRESEGLWIVWPMNCGSKVVTMSYLRIGDRLLLGETDINENKSSHN